MGQQLATRRRFAFRHLSRSAGEQKHLEMPLVERFGAKPFALQPETEVPYKPKLAPGRPAGISLRREPGGEPIEIADQRSNPQPPLAP